MAKNIESLPPTPEAKKPSESSAAVDDLLEHLKTPEAYQNPAEQAKPEEKVEERLPAPPEKADLGKVEQEIKNTDNNLERIEAEKKEEPKVIDIRPDLDAAKKRLEELYGSDKASIDVGLDAKQNLSASEVVEEPTPTDIEKGSEIIIDKSILAVEPEPAINEDIKNPLESFSADTEQMRALEESEKKVEVKPEEEKSIETPQAEVKAEKTSEQIIAEAERAEKLRQQQIENAKKELVETQKAINEAREQKDRTTEHSLLEKAEMSFEIVEGKNLKEKAVERADTELKEEKLVRMKPEQFRQKFTPKAEAMAEQRKRSEVLSKVLSRRWTNLSNEERLKYTTKEGAVDYNKFNVEMVAKIEAKRQELEKKGIAISTNALYAMAERGMRPEDIKVRGFWGRIFKGSDMKIPQDPLFRGEKPIAHELFKNEFEEMVKGSEMMPGFEGEFNRSIKDEAASSIERQIKSGQEMWRSKKQKHVRGTIQETVDRYKRQQEEQLKIEQQKREEEEFEKIKKEKEDKKPEKKKRKPVKKPASKLKKAKGK